MIHVEHLTKRFGRTRAVDDLSFDVAPGEALALWGANGAGKTTLIRCMLGLLRGDGLITIAGHDARRQGKAARRALGYVPQELCLHDDLPALAALRFYGSLKRAAARRPEAVLAEVGLTGHGSKRIRELSGGMKQRLALAIALLADPPLLVLDELTANLDTEARLGFLGLLCDLKRRGKTILFTSHRVDEVAALADRVLLLDSGRRTGECRPEDLADTIGLRNVIRIALAEGTIDRALDVLRARGLAATPNGSGVYVEVAPRDKAAPFRILAEAAVAVRDFEFLGDRSAQRPGRLS